MTDGRCGEDSQGASSVSAAPGYDAFRAEKVIHCEYVNCYH